MRFVLIQLLAIALCCANALSSELVELSLSDAVDAALRQNLTLREQEIVALRAGAEVVAARGEFDHALKIELNRDFQRRSTATALISGEEKTFGYGLSLEGKAITGTRYELSYTGGSVKREDIPFLEINPYYTSELSLLLTQPLLRGFGIEVQKSNVESALEAERMARLQTERKISEVIAQTVEAYWNLYWAVGNLEAVRLSFDLASNLKEEVRARIEAGSLPPVEIYKAEAEVAERRQRVLEARKALGDAEDTLRALMDYDDWSSELVTRDEPPEEATVPEFEEVYTAALEHRGDYLQALADLDRSEVMRRFYKNQKLPDLSLVGGAGLNGLEDSHSRALDDAASGEHYSWKVGVALAVPLGNRTSKGNYLRARHEEEAAQLRVEQLKRSIALEAREALRAFDLARQSMKAARQTRVASENRLNAERERFSLGMATLNDVLSFQEDYAASVSSEERAHSDFAIALVRVRLAAGTLSFDNLR